MIITLNITSIDNIVCSIISIAWSNNNLPVNERNPVSIFMMFNFHPILNCVELGLNLFIWVRYYYVVKDKIQ